MARRAPGFFDVDERLASYRPKGTFRPALEAAVPRADRSLPH
jgi:hypothetical protein